ncbi:rCG27728 [Rattus norvegicus]|uniref:RCG27728 n=1 Tax=Rattus norvegicus TaxID=10116 RepID=A6KBE5_RAT|nr:rCG27728 [Rattus norvegicus]
MLANQALQCQEWTCRIHVSKFCDPIAPSSRDPGLENKIYH